MNGQNNTLKTPDSAYVNEHLKTGGHEKDIDMPDIEKRLELNSRAILESVNDGVIIMGLDHRLLFANTAARRLMGLPDQSGDILGRRCSSLLGHSGCVFGCLIDANLKTNKDGRGYEAELMAGGRRFRLNINTALLRNKDGNVIGGIEVLKDVTRLKELEEELRGKYSFASVIGNNWKMHEIFELIKEVAPTKAAIFIEGETGTGKELIAGVIHHNSKMSGGPLVKVNCAGLPEELIESELFGHVKGAFNGAISDRIGRIEMADNGTLLIEEIARLGESAQIRLLRLMQEGIFERTGSVETKRSNVRVIATTNRELGPLVENGKFREDLYYRLRVAPMHLPPLRQRKDDIPLLVKHFMQKFNAALGANVTDISPLAMERLLEYNFPGNVRELEHAIEHAFIRCREGALQPEHLPRDMQLNNMISRAMDDPEPLKSLERAMIIKTLGDTRWKYTESAKKLKISRTTLWRRMKELKIEKTAR